MESTDLDQYQRTPNEEIVEPRIQVSKDGKWIILRLEVEGRRISVIKPVAYFEKILERARNRYMPGDVERIK